MKSENTSISRKRSIAGNIVITLGSLMLIGSAGAKFAHVPVVVTQFGAMGFAGNRLFFIAALEVISALLFLLPSTRSIGLLLVSSYMGGAIAAHVGHGQPFLQPAFVLALLWLGAWLRHPEILWSLSTIALRAEEPASKKHQKSIPQGI